MAVSVLAKAKHYEASPVCSSCCRDSHFMPLIIFYGLGPSTQCTNTRDSKNPNLFSKPRKEGSKLSRLKT